MSLPIREQVEKDFGIDLSEFDVRTQYQFLNFIKTKSADEFPKIIKFKDKFGRNGLTAFLAMEYGAEIGDKIIDFSDKSPEISKEIYSRYTNIIDLADRFETGWESIEKDTLSSFVLSGEEKDIIKGVPAQISESIRRRAKDLFLALDLVSSEENNYGAEDAALAFEALESSLTYIAALYEANKKYDFSLKESQSSPDGSEKSYSFGIKQGDKGSVGDTLSIFIRKSASDRGQARINFSIKPSEEHLRKAFSQKVRYGEKMKQLQDIRIGFDLDKDKDGNMRGFSMDIGRSPFEREAYEREGDILGKMLALASEHKSHNYDSFDQRISNPKVFEKIAVALTKFLDSKSTKK
ncbi:hypothetical protein COY62_00050 [bacterium (Candidatus Howlettbacteria) CG_4_10_14_0_8_um_filter_40_9]|nr:MAG: hypothetical protein COY62_00050 [bacterium (Candidatus Howlettbacteria) CG_4_10_14_0_8_um_filter_40_9]